MTFIKNKYIEIIFIKLFLLLFPFNAMAISGFEINKKLKLWLSNKNISSNPNFSSNKIYKSCINDIKFETVFSNYSLIRAMCPDVNGWEIYIKSNLTKKNKNKNKKINNLKKIIVLKYSHEKGDIITEDSLKVELKKVNNSFFSNDKQLLGRKLKQNLKKGQIIKPRHLYKKFEIHEGDPVIIKSSIGLITVTSSGIASKSGNLGDLIEAKNIRSGKIIKGFLKKNKIIQVYR